MRRLADEKLHELVATGDFQIVTEGDFSDIGEARYAWTSALDPTGVENLDVLTVIVTRSSVRDDSGFEASQLLFIPPTTTGGQSP